MLHRVYMRKNPIILILLMTFYLLLATPIAEAFTSEGEDYILHMHINTDPDENAMQYNQVNPSPARINTSTQTKAIIMQPTLPIKKVLGIQQTKTTIEEGYLGNNRKEEFMFSLLDDIINYGPLSPTNFITRASTIVLSGAASYNYTVLSYENNSLQNQNNQSIPNTGCDDGNCTAISASEWSDPLTFGFGYHCGNTHGQDCLSFSEVNDYKKFSQGTLYQAEPVLEGNLYQEKQAKIFYNINVPGTQASGIYQNTISYIAVPMY